MRTIALPVLSFITLFTLAGCGTTGQLGLVTRSSVAPESLLKSGKAYRELGPVWGKVCGLLDLDRALRSFDNIAKAVEDAFMPVDNFTKVVEDALAQVDADALINVTTSTHRYPYLFLRDKGMDYCTLVQGTAIKFIDTQNAKE